MSLDTINSRASWGARYDDGDISLYGPAEDVVVHHTVTHADGGTPAAERAHMLFLEGIGQSRFGHGISYNVLVFPSGRAYQGVSFSRRGTHTGGHNSTVRSVCFVGNFENDTPTPAALATAAAIIADGRGELWRRDARVLGHRDFKGTECPGDHLYARLADLAAGPTTPEDDMPLSNSDVDRIAKAVWSYGVVPPSPLFDALGKKTTMLKLVKAIGFRLKLAANDIARVKREVQED